MNKKIEKVLEFVGDVGLIWSGFIIGKVFSEIRLSRTIHKEIKANDLAIGQYYDKSIESQKKADESEDEATKRLYQNRADGYNDYISELDLVNIRYKELDKKLGF